MDLTQEEIKFMHYRLGLTGSFTTSLYETYFKADGDNAQKLETAFPQLLVCRRYRNEEGYWISLCQRWNETANRKINPDA
jgi:hypothetical protein